MRTFLTIFLILCFVNIATAKSIVAGTRIVIDSEWHKANGGAYKPRVVECNSNSGLCLRDTRNNPANTKLVRTGLGLKATYRNWGIVYVFKSNGKGIFTNIGGKKIGNFIWSQ